MDTSDTHVLSRWGRSIWSNVKDWERSTLDVVTALSLVHLPEERSMERAAKLLLDRARQADLSQEFNHGAPQWVNPFFRLPVDQRFILSGLHQVGWSYLRLSRVLGVSVEEIEKLAWSARIQLNVSTPFPSTKVQTSPQCPEFESSRPWTQRFLDDQMSSRRDLIFLQTHLFGCDSCRSALERSRVIYYEAEKQIPSGQEGDSLVPILDHLVSLSPNRQRQLGEEFLVSLKSFLGRVEIQRALIWVALLIIFLWRLQH